MTYLKLYIYGLALSLLAMQPALGLSLVEGDRVYYEIMRDDGTLYRSGTGLVHDSYVVFHPFSIAEFIIGADYRNVYIRNGSSPTFSFGGIEYFRVYDLDWDNSGVTISGINVSSSGVRSFTNVTATFGPNEVFIYPGIDSVWESRNSYINVRLETTPVPLPAPAWLLGSGLSWLLLATRKYALSQ